MDDGDFASRKSFLAETDACFERGDDETALDLAQSRLEKIPEDLSARIVICRAWLIRGRIDEAREILAEIEEMLSGVSRLFSYMGDLYSKKGLEKEAEMFYRKFAALETKPFLSLEMDKKPDTLEESAPEESAGVEEYGNNDEGEEKAEMPPGFETVTLAELYMKQGHYQTAHDLLVKIIKRETDNDRAAELLKDIRDRLAQEQTGAVNEDVVNELSKWLKNIGGLGRHA